MRRAWDRQLLKLINRDYLPLVLKDWELTGKIVEVGTYYGKFAEHLLRLCRNDLVCIDPWADLPDSEYRDGCANAGRSGGRNPMEPIFEEAMRRLKPFGDRVQVMRDKSAVAVQAIEDYSCAAVYIDANHAYRFALEDLRLWWPKVQVGGILGIHDCYVRIDLVQNCQVADAVFDFALAIERRPFLTACTSAWWLK